MVLNLSPSLTFSLSPSSDLFSVLAHVVFVVSSFPSFHLSICSPLLSFEQRTKQVRAKWSIVLHSWTSNSVSLTESRLSFYLSFLLTTKIPLSNWYILSASTLFTSPPLTTLFGTVCWWSIVSIVLNLSVFAMACPYWSFKPSYC